MIPAIIKWATLLMRILPLLEELYEHVIAIVAVVRTERKTWDPGSSDMKRIDATEFLKGFSVFAGKNQKTLNRIVESALNFVNHKEK